MYAIIAARWALVDTSLAVGDSVGIGRAIGVAATRALRLRQYLQNAVNQGHCIQAVARRLLLATGLALAEVLAVALSAGFFAAAFLVLG